MDITELFKDWQTAAILLGGGIGAGVVAALGRMGWVQAAKANVQPPRTEVAAMVLDQEAIKRLADELHGLTKAMNRNADEVGRLREEMRISREVNAANR